MAPGPELGVLLGGLDTATLTGTDLVEVLRARARQLSMSRPSYWRRWWRSGCVTRTPGRFAWISPLRRSYHVSCRPITTDLPGPLPRSEQYPAYAPPFTGNENWPILNRPPPEPILPPSSAHVIDPDEPPPF
jgi:hypothetical protein